ncbi:MAG: serine/threonine protein kinase, partial [Chloroflexi bacterium]|nr:serine/threonine protein kinase [Chloroflexota bacterium]
MHGELSGTRFAGYELGEMLGYGGMASVYLAQQVSIGRTVAIKIMPAHLTNDPQFLERFKQEVQLIAALQHPRVLPVYDYGELEGRPFIVMAHINGGTLADRIAAGPMPIADIDYMVAQIAEGLDHAHQSGVIHRDIKPSNVLLDTRGNAYLADFGLAKITEAGPNLTGTHVVGTPAYMAPEMAYDDGEVTHLSD